jgi:hypothetical protein
MKPVGIRAFKKAYPKAAKAISETKKSRRVVTEGEVKAAERSAAKAKKEIKARVESYERGFSNGMVFALIQIVHENPACAPEARSVFDAAGLTRKDFKETGIEYDTEALNRILED